MYSRYSNHYGRVPGRVPENYSGCAFRSPRENSDLPPDTSRNEPPARGSDNTREKFGNAGLPVPFSPPLRDFSKSTGFREQMQKPDDDEPLIPPVFPSMRGGHQKPPEDCPSPPNPEPPDRPDPPPRKPPFDLLHHLTAHDGKLPFFGGLDFEELLLIGLILLLSGSEQESDVTLVLALLLLCG